MQFQSLKPPHVYTSFTWSMQEILSTVNYPLDCQIIVYGGCGTSVSLNISFYHRAWGETLDWLDLEWLTTQEIGEDKNLINTHMLLGSIALD